MEHNYDHNWRSLWKRRPLRIAVGVSVIAHAVAFGALLYRHQDKILPPIPVTYSVQYSALPEPETIAPEIPEPPIPELEPPKPPPPPPEPKPDPPKKKPEKPKVKKKPDPPKKKEEPKPKPKPEPEPKKEPPPKKPPTPPKAGIQSDELPSVLNTWGRLVQRKVAKFWVVPGGVHLEEGNAKAVISFWVNREGRIVAGPTVSEAASDPALGESGIRAVLAAAPFPRLPKNFSGDRQEVLYVFNLE
jgi:outer membrane biosynthesis protein TonB